MWYRGSVAAAVFILSVFVWLGWLSGRVAGTAASDPESIAVESAISRAADSRVDGRRRTADSDLPEFDQVVSDESSLGDRVSPSEIEGAIYRRLAEQSGLALASINAVDCDYRACSVALSGLAANPQFTDEYSDLLSALTQPPWEEYQATSGSIGTREVAPGAREYVLALTYIAFVDKSEDPTTAARQYAACAGAWARVSQQRGSDEYISRAHQKAAEWLELSANVLGQAEAQRLAGALQFGPLTRDCQASPY